MKVIVQLLTLVSVFAVSTPVLAGGFQSERMRSGALKLSPIESQLGSEDKRTVDYALTLIEQVLTRYRPSAPSYICLSNGRPGSFERFTITDPTNGDRIGSETAIETCRQAIQSLNQNLMCISNGQAGSFERFTPYDIERKNNLGSETEWATCQAIVARATSLLACVSNGRAGSFEEFTLYNRDLQRTLGGGTQLSQCLENLPL